MAAVGPQQIREVGVRTFAVETVGLDARVGPQKPHDGVVRRVAEHALVVVVPAVGHRLIIVERSDRACTLAPVSTAFDTPVRQA
jgi:hypothetical protein